MIFSVAQILIVGLSAVLALATVIPFANIAHGLVRGPEFIRLQILGLSALLTPLAWATLSGPVLSVTLFCLVSALVINLACLVKFTPLWPKQSRHAGPRLQTQQDRHLSLLTANVKKSNRRYDLLLDLVRDTSPDVLALIETDQKWIKALSLLRAEYRYHVEVPRDTGYGLGLYSRLPLNDVDVRDMITDGVPSIKARVTLRSGDDIRLYVVHPEPPVASAKTTGRDSEIAKAGLAAKNDPLPAIIAGDLNDVAWSHTTRLFQRITGLLDPRVGRGFFNTFNAFRPVMRWPLDHLFHDARFRLIDMQRLAKINSDHFPMHFTLALASEEEGETPDERAGETRQVKSTIEHEKSKDRRPVGTDWEDEN